MFAIKADGKHAPFSEVHRPFDRLRQAQTTLFEGDAQQRHHLLRIDRLTRQWRTHRVLETPDGERLDRWHQPLAFLGQAIPDLTPTLLTFALDNALGLQCAELAREPLGSNPG